MKKACIVFCDESSSMLNEGPCYNRIFLVKQRCRSERLTWLSKSCQREFPEEKHLCFALCKSRSKANGTAELQGEPACHMELPVRVSSAPLGERGHGVFDSVCLCQALWCSSKALGIVKICSLSAPRLMK